MRTNHTLLPATAHPGALCPENVAPDRRVINSSEKTGSGFAKLDYSNVLRVLSFPLVYPSSTHSLRQRFVPAARTILITALLLTGAGTASADGASPHIRIRDRILRSLLDHGLAHSSTLNTLVAQIEESDVLVFVDCNLFLPSGVAARLTLVTSVGTMRYVRVEVRCSLQPRLQLAMLAHEFQHAVEVADTPAITDNDSMANFYEGIGFQTFTDGTHKAFETAAAIAMQKRVDEEVWGRPRTGDVSATH